MRPEVKESARSSLFTVTYFPVRSSRSRALRYGLPSFMSVKTTKGAGGGLGGGKKNRGTVITSLASEACWLTWFILNTPKILRVFAQDAPYVLWKRTFKRNDDLSTTSQCRQLKQNPLSTQINIHRLMNNQTPALLVQRAPWTRAAVMLLQSPYFSRCRHRLALHDCICLFE